MSDPGTTAAGESGEPHRGRLRRLAAQAAELPREPGVYLMKDAQGRVIYVGKALRLRDRVGSYFQSSTNLGPKKQPMLEVVESFDVLRCESEWEALLAENRLIKDIKPRFNARLSDGKTFPYLVVTMRDDYPGVYITRQPAAPEYAGARVFGPFTSPHSLRQATLLLQRVFKFRTCRLDILESDDKRRFFRPCILHAIGQCTAPCADRVPKTDYRADIDRFIRLLSTKHSDMLRELRAEMAAAAAALRFEQAAMIRDRIRAIERLGDRGRRSDGWQPEAESFVADPRKGLRALQKILALPEPVRCLEAIDIAHLMGGETVGSKVCFVDGRPLRSEYRKFRVRTAGNNDYAAIREVVSRRYREAADGAELFPDVILVDGGLGQLHAALEAFDALGRSPPMVISLAKKEELIYVQHRPEPVRLGRDNPGLRLCQAARDEAHRFAQSYHHVLRRNKTLGEPGVAPRRTRSTRAVTTSSPPPPPDAHPPPDAPPDSTAAASTTDAPPSAHPDEQRTPPGA